MGKQFKYKIHHSQQNLIRAARKYEQKFHPLMHILPSFV